MRVVVNGIPLLQPLTGVGQYIHQLFSEIARRPEVDLSLFYGFGVAKAVRPPVAAGGGLVGGSLGLVRRFLPGARSVKRALESAAFRYHVGTKRDCLYHEPNFLPLPYRGPAILTIHDLSCFDLPETHPPERVRLLEKYLPPALERAAHLLVVAECTKRSLCERFSVAPERVSVTPLAADARFRPQAPAAIAGELARHGLAPGGYLLAVGTLEPRKNLETLFTAYGALPESLRRRFPLVVAGMPGWHLERMMRCGQALLERGELKLLGYVVHETLPQLYAGAAAFVYPSRYEGFGLPPLEAMAAGVPVITGNRTSLPEVVGDAGILVDPDDVDGFRAAIVRLLEDRRYAAELAARGVRRAGEFSWTRCADETLAVYARVARQQGSAR